MSEYIDVLQSLKNTEKGKLHYDRNWLKKGNINIILEECSSPPQLKGFSPKEEKIKLPEQSNGDNANPPFQTSTPVQSRKDTDCLTPKITPIDHAIKYVEGNWDAKAKSRIEDRKELFKQHTAMLIQQAENQLIRLYFHQEKKSEQIISQAEAKEKLRTEELKKKHLKLKEHHKQHARLLDARLQEAHKKKKEDEEMQRKREAELRQKLISMGKIQQEINTIKDNIEQSLAACPNLKYVAESTRNSGALMTHITEKVHALIQEAASKEPTDKIMQALLQLQGNAKNVYDCAHSQIDAANKKAAEETALKDKKKQEELKKQQQELEKKQQEQQQAASDRKQAVQSLLANQDDTEQIYKGYKTLAENTLKSCEPLMDASNKKIKFELQKAVNLPVNAISRASGAHLRDKLNRLTTLLSGQPVEVTGKKVSTHIHPVAFQFVKDLIAKKMVKQGEDQVSSSMESAFPIAAVAVGVWCEFPDVGEMLLAHFFNTCPYLVPYYIPKVDGQSAEEYYKSLGYRYEAGQIEKQDKFLKRMTGVMHLYAAIFVSHPPKGHSNHPHPHNLEHGWIWLSRIMNLDPRPDITATMIHSFLTVAGHSLIQLYGRQFLKLLKVLKDDFMPKVKAVTPKSAGGPLTRLEVFLDKCTVTGHISSPEGILPSTFW